MTEQHTPQLISRDEWQDEVRTKHPLVNPNSRIQPPHTISSVGIVAPQLAVLAFVSTLSDEDEEKFRPLSEKIETEVRGTLGEGAHEDIVFREFTKAMFLEPEIAKHIAIRDMSAIAADLEKVLPMFEKSYKEGLARGVDEGFLPKEVLARFDEAMKKTSIRGADSTFADVDGADAYHLRGIDEIIIVDKGSDNEQIYIEDLAHEMTHKLSGGTFSTAVQEDGKQQYRTGLGTGREARESIRTGWNEFADEHVARSILYGEFEILDPDSRDGDDTIYYGYRKIAAHAYEKSDGHMKVKTLIHALFEDTGPGGGFEARHAFIQEVVDCYGYGAIRKIEKIMMHTDIVGCDDKAQAALFERIHPPEIDEHGTIVKKGWIDADALPSNDDIHGVPEAFKALEALDSTKPNPFSDYGISGVQVDMSKGSFGDNFVVVDATRTHVRNEH